MLVHRDLRSTEPPHGAAAIERGARAPIHSIGIYGPSMYKAGYRPSVHSAADGRQDHRPARHARPAPRRGRCLEPDRGIARDLSERYALRPDRHPAVRAGRAVRPRPGRVVRCGREGDVPGLRRRRIRTRRARTGRCAPSRPPASCAPTSSTACTCAWPAAPLDARAHVPLRPPAGRALPAVHPVGRRGAGRSGTDGRRRADRAGASVLRRGRDHGRGGVPELDRRRDLPPGLPAGADRLLRRARRPPVR